MLVVWQAVADSTEYPGDSKQLPVYATTRASYQESVWAGAGARNIRGTQSKGMYMRRRGQIIKSLFGQAQAARNIRGLKATAYICDDAGKLSRVCVDRHELHGINFVNYNFSFFDDYSIY